MLRRIKRALKGAPVTILPAIPVVDFSSFVETSEFDIRVAALSVSNGNVTFAELFVINSLIKLRNPGAIFEIGTFDGRTTLNMAANSEASTRIVTLDLPSQELGNTLFPIEEVEKQYVEKRESGGRFSNHPEAGKITQVYGDSAQFDFSKYENTIDFVFVDASHAYEYVLNDSKVALRLLRDGKGMILWHDYNRPEWWPGVMKGLDELYRGDERFSRLVHFEGTSLVCLVRD